MIALKKIEENFDVLLDPKHMLGLEAAPQVTNSLAPKGDDLLASFFLFLLSVRVR